MRHERDRVRSFGLPGVLLFIGCSEAALIAPPGVERADAQMGGSGPARDASPAGAAARPPQDGSAGSGGSGVSGGAAGTSAQDAGSDTSGDAAVGAGDSGFDAAAAADSSGADADAAAVARVVINEIVVDPQNDWNDSAGGGTPFDRTPGNGAVTSTDEWVELYNAGGAPVDLSGWSLVMTDGTPAIEPLGTGDAVLRFSAGGVVTAFRAGEYLVIGNPKGDLNNGVTLELYDSGQRLVDRVVLGGDGGAPRGNATGSDDEAIARVPNGADSGDDAADFPARPATPGAAN